MRNSLRGEKNVQEQFLEDKIGKIESSESFKKFFKPVTESQRKLTKEIKEQFAPIRDKVLTLPSQTLAVLTAYRSSSRDTTYRSSFRAQPTDPPLEIKERDEELMNVGPIAAKYLEKYASVEGVDKVFGINVDYRGTWRIGNKEMDIEGNDLIIDGVKYPGTRGLWELLKDPSEENYDDEDYATY